MTDQECLEKIRRGGKDCTDGVSRLYRDYARRFLAYFLKHRVPRQYAEELVQDVFVNVVRKCQDFRGDTRIDAWMWAIVRNALIDHVRRQRPEVRVDDEELLDSLADATADTPAEPDTGLEECVRKAYAAFAEAQNFPFHLLSDVDRAVGTTYEIVRAPDDKYPEYPMRQSYLIDPGGRIHRHYSVTDVASHAADVIADLEAAQTET